MDGGVDEAGVVTLVAWSPGLAAVAAVVALGPGARPPSRLAILTNSATRRRWRRSVFVQAGINGRWSGLVEWVGRSISGVVGMDPDAGRARRLGQTLLVGLAAGALHPLLVVPVAAVAWAGPALTERTRRRRRAAQVVAETPDLVELFRLAVGAGLTVHLAVEAVAPRAHGVTGEALARVPARVAVGERLADSLAAVADCGDGVRPLVAALVASERYGVALGPSLERVAFEARLSRRRSAEEAARRLPVLLLFPLVLCILPAFVLLTVVPLLVGSLPRLTG